MRSQLRLLPRHISIPSATFRLVFALGSMTQCRTVLSVVGCATARHRTRRYLTTMGMALHHLLSRGRQVSGLPTELPNLTVETELQLSRYWTVGTAFSTLLEYVSVCLHKVEVIKRANHSLSGIRYTHRTIAVMTLSSKRVGGPIGGGQTV